MNELSDQQLLREYAGRRSEEAFSELVARHVDLVYSAALRLLGDAHLAEDVTQSVFLALAGSATHLAERPVLSGWLHRTTRNLAANSIRSAVRRRAWEHEAAAMNELPSAASEDTWQRVAPELDTALGELTEAERDALLLRYFEGKSARQMAELLGTTEAAAQKRVNRAVERLQGHFARAGVAVGAGTLVAAISTNAVQAAPVGLGAAIATAAALAGSAVETSAIQAGTKIIAMTTLQKAVVATALTLAIGTGFFEARRASTFREQVQALRQNETTTAGAIEQLNHEREATLARQTALLDENERLRRETIELPKLRAEVARLRSVEKQFAQVRAASHDANDPFTRSVLALSDRAAELNQHLAQRPDKSIPELQFLSENDWLNAAKDVKFDTDADIRKALSNLRSIAKSKLPLGGALNAFIQANGGELPADLTQLKPFFKKAADEVAGPNWSGADPASTDAALNSILQRYSLVHSGNVTNLPPDTWIVVEKAPVDRDYDSRAKFGNGRSSVTSTGLGEFVAPEDQGY